MEVEDEKRKDPVKESLNEQVAPIPWGTWSNLWLTAVLILFVIALVFSLINTFGA